ncbi:hypothetical protein [Oceanicoccus sagamiensis]|uniref:MSHA biogenesis protein MshI n=1 Tax=Oceanicoccus sagamiensis TaxID=716816 RepID=A0A1X9N679_9GAMM|nr:hypothetical protein [Oceanicoccus sagamiensis]ARN73598.1 hypothetical protein BST96_05365 [Oceanicoccus sagamiensis]
MAISTAWLSKWFNKNDTGRGRVGLAVGPDGLAITMVNHLGVLEYCQFHDPQGDSSQLLADIVAEKGWEDTPCSVVLHPVYYQLLLTEEPPVEGDEIQAAVRWKVKEFLDFPVEEAAIAYFGLPEDAYRGRQKMLYAAALRKTTLQSLISPIEASGLNVDCVEIAELAMHNIISRLPQEGGGIAMVQLHEGEGFINLVEDGAVYLTRRLDIGLDKFNAGVDNTRFFDALFLEIQRSLDYYESQLGKGIITRLFYSPGLPETVPIGDFLSAQLGLNVAPLELSMCEVAEAISDNEQLIRSASAVGAALGPQRSQEAIRAAS